MGVEVGYNLSNFCPGRSCLSLFGYPMARATGQLPLNLCDGCFEPIKVWHILPIRNRSNDVIACLGF